MTTIIIDNEPQYLEGGPPGVFVPLAEVDVLTAQLTRQLATLTAERTQLRAESDSLRAALQQAQDERGRLRDALTDMLYIFDRGLPDNSLGRMRCDQARDALNGPNQNQLQQENQNEQRINPNTKRPTSHN